MLDTREGDVATVLREICIAVDGWFTGGGRNGLTEVAGVETLDQLVADGVLALAPRRRANVEAGGGNTAAGLTRPRLRTLIRVPAWGPVPVARPPSLQPGGPAAVLQGPDHTQTPATTIRQGFPNPHR